MERRKGIVLTQKTHILKSKVHTLNLSAKNLLNLPFRYVIHPGPKWKIEIKVNGRGDNGYSSTRKLCSD